MDQLAAMIMSKQAAASDSPLPLLQRLTLDDADPNYDFGGLYMCSSLREPHIKHLKSTHLDVIDVQNLVTLEVQIYGGPSFVVLLQRCPLLQTLTLCLVDNTPAVNLSSPFSHIHLTTLNLSRLSSSFHFPRNAWELIRLPNLTHLYIRAHGNRTYTDLEDPLAHLYIRAHRDRTKPDLESPGEVNITFTSHRRVLNELLEMLLWSDCSLQKVSIHKVYEESSRGYAFYSNTDTVLDDFLKKVPVSSTGLRLLDPEIHVVLIM